MAEIVCLTCPFIACILLILYFEPYPKILTFYANETRRNKQVSKMGITDPNDCLVLNLNHLIKSSSGEAAIPLKEIWLQSSQFLSPLSHLITLAIEFILSLGRKKLEKGKRKKRGGRIKQGVIGWWVFQR